ncbi:glutathione transport system ATP-binding protein [Limimaricola soesokkakensis]|uniref:Glutathione import ATP-binding protein GsiA n=1 Tax=Limimaricola soesokkakensis TaxID=1343159 RepID=A0A1X6ZP82_9RHOB|nr:ABC transporter ATP-binding protein [Limimaricola soesokkakensis]PSK85795.1 glutathione transport system ATP-binding protein [Limimaricola soesokkakensis]SLN57023.1 Glutathione import ATP-binding protein GsiA [Limimaricola soesokkakensis]
MSDTTAPILTVEDLSISFGDTEAVRGLSFEVPRGGTLAIVGESGSGKSVTSMAAMGLLKFTGGRVTSGRIQLHGKGGETEITGASEADLRRIRGNRISMIFQEPMTSLDPVFTIGSQIGEALKLHRGLRGRAARDEAARLLELVRLPNARAQLDRYPHQLSGGMRQRVMIAMAVSCRPDLLIADEPTTALDVTIQAQILQIIRDMQSEFGTSVVFISHDMGVVSEMADEIVVMRHGEMVEAGRAEDVILRPKADYTRALMAAVPKIGAMQGQENPRKFDLPGQAADQTDAHPAPERTEPLVRLDKVTTRYDLTSGFLGRVSHRVHAAEEVSFEIHPGETLALVGESGSGKSTVGKTLQQLVTPVSGRILYRGTDILSLDPAERQRFKREIQYIFQDPYGSLNPRKTVKQSLIEPMATHGLLKKADAQVADLLTSVGLKPEHAGRYPHEFSGGQRQRIAIARALSVDPGLIIADEAVSALDVSVQAQVINLMMDIQARRGLAYLFISHDMAVVERVSHRVAVMYLGEIVEMGTRRQVFETPQHPYTKRLLRAVPVMDPTRPPERVTLTGDIPSPVRPVGDPRRSHGFVEVAPGHLLADNHQDFEKYREGIAS